VETKVHLRGLSTIASAAWVIGMATSLRANTFFVTATRTGWFASNGQHTSGNNNYEIGDIETPGFLLRDFATFTLPLPGAGQKFVAATLTIPTNTVSTSDPSETATFFDVSTSASTLNASHSSGDSAGLAAYNDLGSGTIFGSQVYFPSDPPGSSIITLNSAALDAMNAAVPGSSFSIGGAVTSLDAVDNIEIIYTGAVGPFHQLALTTGPAPEPGSAVMLGMIAAVFTARRKGRDNHALQRTGRAERSL
jgi:hypothetical protein